MLRPTLVAMDPRILLKKEFLEYLKAREFCGPPRAGDVSWPIFFLPAASPLIFGLQVALGYGTVHTKNGQSVTLYIGDISILVKIGHFSVISR